ncbi:MAG TPA: hypothetical protein P5181_11660 [Dermatophilaceae bacterium]|nr:hypothetical protein [Dermatophilaceae bacterium]
MTEPTTPRPAPTPPRRVRITSPRRGARRRAERRPGSVELTEQTGLGEVYLTALLRAQLRLSLAVLLGVVGMLAGLPAVFLLLPDARSAMVGPVPLAWVVVGVAVYPVVYAAARLHVRQAERIEREFTDLVRR